MQKIQQDKKTKNKITRYSIGDLVFNIVPNGYDGYISNNTGIITDIKGYTIYCIAWLRSNESCWYQEETISNNVKTGLFRLHTRMD